jgi:hypothetical protein
MIIPERIDQQGGPFYAGRKCTHVQTQQQKSAVCLAVVHHFRRAGRSSAHFWYLAIGNIRQKNDKNDKITTGTRRHPSSRTGRAKIAASRWTGISIGRRRSYTETSCPLSPQRVGGWINIEMDDDLTGINTALSYLQPAITCATNTRVTHMAHRNQQPTARTWPSK